MAKEVVKKRLNVYFNIADPREKEIWDFLESKYSKTAIVKESLETQMNLEKQGMKTIAPATKEEIKDEVASKESGITIPEEDADMDV